jgi:hypothetical protein
LAIKVVNKGSAFARPGNEVREGVDGHAAGAGEFGSWMRLLQWLPGETLHSLVTRQHAFWVVTSSTAAGTYSGTLTATPSSGSAASASVSLTVNTAPALTLTQIAATGATGATTTPTAATVTYRLSNTGQTATSVSCQASPPSPTSWPGAAH